MVAGAPHVRSTTLSFLALSPRLRQEPSHLASEPTSANKHLETLRGDGRGIQSTGSIWPPGRPTSAIFPLAHSPLRRRREGDLNSSGGREGSPRLIIQQSESQPVTSVRVIHPEGTDGQGTRDEFSSGGGGRRADLGEGENSQRGVERTPWIPSPPEPEEESWKRAGNNRRVRIKLVSGRPPR